MGFETIRPGEIPGDVFDRFRLGMPLLSAAHGGACNTMTVSWGQMGFLWNKPVATVYVRPQRYTFPLIDAAAGYSLSFLSPDRYREEIQYCGKASGRDGDKFGHCGFTVARHEDIPYIEQAELVLICRKSYSAWLTEDGFADPSIVAGAYAAGDFHKLYTGEITAVLRAK